MSDIEYQFVVVRGDTFDEAYNVLRAMGGLLLSEGWKFHTITSVTAAYGYTWAAQSFQRQREIT